ncbi:peptidoglycan recognition protein family protein [Nocardiopsis sp. NPDC055551]
MFTDRGLPRAQAAQGTNAGNQQWYSVTLMLGGNEQPTKGHIQAVLDLRAYLMARGVGGTIRGHRDFVAISCPGEVLYRLVADGTFGAKGNGNPSAGGGGGMTSVRSIRSQQAAVNSLGHNPKLDMASLWGPLTEAGVKWLRPRSASARTVCGVRPPRPPTRRLEAPPPALPHRSPALPPPEGLLLRPQGGPGKFGERHRPASA